MPPVLGPPSPSSRRLASWAGSSGSTVVPSVTANSDTSGPSRYSSTSTAPPASSTRWPWATAAARSSVTSTPLPAASPSSFTTYGAPASSSAVSSSAGPPTGQDRAVGTPAAVITCLANDLLPSNCAASADGPKQAMPVSRTASAAPATSGTSGPMTTSSAPHSRATRATASGSAASTGRGSATARVPALPGAQASALTAGSEDRATHRACSRAPEPITSTRTGAESRGRSPQPVRLLPHRPVQGAHPGLLRSSRAGVHAQQLAVRLGLELAPGAVPRGVQRPVVDGGGHGTAWLAAVPAVAEPAVVGERRDVGVGGVDALAVLVQAELPHAGGVDQEAAAGQQVQLARGRRVPTAAVARADLPGVGEGATGERVDQTGLPDAGRADHRAGAAAWQQRTDAVQSHARHRADRQHLHPRCALANLLDRSRDVVAQVRLGEDDDRCRPAAPGDGEIALQPPQPGLARQRVDDEDRIQVRRDHLRPRRPAGDG